MKIEIVKQHRKTIALKVLDSENAVLKVPISLSDKKINDFLNSKKNWLEKVSTKMKNAENFSSSFDLKKYVYLDGKPIMKVEECVLGFSQLSEKAKAKSILNVYLSSFHKLEKMAHEISLETGLKYKELKPIDSVRVWGSYNDKRLMKLNWKLVILPERLAFYVICHELCHSIHMNHKPQFWKDVARICPDYKILKKELAKFSFVLKFKF